MPKKDTTMQELIVGSTVVMGTFAQAIFLNYILILLIIYMCMVNILTKQIIQNLAF